MIETQQIVTIGVGINPIWDYVRDIRRWAELMPGMRECDVIDDNNSRWVLKVGVGGLVRTVTVDVQVDQWNEPGHVIFAYRLKGDPVNGGGTYTAIAKGPNETEITLDVRVVGSGPLAPMWEAMGRPLLPQLAKGFAGQLKDAIELHYGADGTAPAADATPGPDARPSLIARIVKWFRRLWK